MKKTLLFTILASLVASMIIGCNSGSAADTAAKPEEPKARAAGEGEDGSRVDPQAGK